MPRRPPAVARVLEKVTATAREHDMFSPGDRVLVAVSGGPDSICLLYSLHMLRRLFKIQLEVFHFDHKLRADSAKDAAYVKRTAAKLNLPFHLVEAATKPLKGASLEDWAHRARFHALTEVLRAIGFRRTAFGHTMDDQAETVLIALMRGGGSLTGIAPVSHFLLHPLLDVRRAETHAYVRSLGLRPRLDPTNRDLRFMRNALRLDGMPVLEKALGRDIVEPIARTAELLRLDSDFVHDAYQRILRQNNWSRSPGERLPVKLLASLHPAMSSRLIKDALHTSWRDVTQAHIDSVMDLAKGRPGRKIDLPGGFTAVREREYIRISSPEVR
jgi:tRNA(Ile)-lysidine synthase